MSHTESAPAPERTPIQQFFDEVACNSGKYIYGVKNLQAALEMSAVDKVIIWEDLDMYRVEHMDSGVAQVKYLPKGEATGDAVLLKDWLIAHSKDYNMTVEVIDKKSQDGAKFVTEFGGIGCVLRWKVDFN